MRARAQGLPLTNTLREIADISTACAILISPPLCMPALSGKPRSLSQPPSTNSHGLVRMGNCPRQFPLKRGGSLALPKEAATAAGNCCAAVAPKRAASSSATRLSLFRSGPLLCLARNARGEDFDVSTWPRLSHRATRYHGTARALLPVFAAPRLALRPGHVTITAPPPENGAEAQVKCKTGENLCICMLV